MRPPVAEQIVGDCMGIRWAFAAAFAAFCACSAGARSISVQVIQNLPGQERVWDATRLFEQGVIDYYFFEGNIVSNSPIWIHSTESKNRGALGAALIENYDGGMEYLVRFELFFNIANSMNPHAPILENIEKVEWTIYSTESGQELTRGTGTPAGSPSQQSGETAIAQFAAVVAKDAGSRLAQ